MSTVSGLLGGGTPVIKKYQVGETFATAGVPAIIDASTEAGVNLATTTGSNDQVGITLDTATYSTAQGTGTSSAEALVSVIINPDAIIRSRMSGTTAAGGDLSAQTNTTASSGGTVITTGAAWNSPTFADGQVWGLSGNNVGRNRKITTVGGTSGTVVVPFDYAIAVNDTYLRAPISPMASIVVQLCTELTEVDMSAAISGDVEWVCIDVELNGVGDSYAHFISGDHILNPI